MRVRTAIPKVPLSENSRMAIKRLSGILRWSKKDRSRPKVA